MIGKTVSARSARLYLKPERVTISANTSPNAVVTTPTTIARNREFHATPQRIPRRHPSPHIRSSKNFAAKTLTEYMPSSVMNAATNILAMGKKTKTVTTKIMPPMALTTKTSPLTAPRAAMPWVKRKRNELASNKAP